MKKKMSLLLALTVLLGAFVGCAKEAAPATEPQTATETTEPALVLPPDGNPGDVTCKGTYTGEVNNAQVVARVGGRELTNGLLQAYYWAQAAAFRGSEAGPDYSRRLDAQPCPLDDAVASWQQFFLKRALNAWHSAQALVIQSESERLTTEAAYQPNPETHADNVVGKPATQFLYGYQETYRPNTMHQAYLDSLPQVLETLAAEKGYASALAMAGEAFGTTEENLLAFADLYNRGYMYLTFLNYDTAQTVPLADQGGAERCVDIRHILASSPEEARNLLTAWEKAYRTDEAAFAELAVRNSLDSGTALDGGAYYRLCREQLPEELDSWCFDPARQPGDTAVLGSHVLYFSGSAALSAVQTQQEAIAQAEITQIDEAKAACPMEVDYSAIVLGNADPAVNASELLYPDVAHERFPEAPLYLQQDYPHTLYGAFPIRTHGCGITTMAMLATYMTDTPLTPPTMCERYGQYCHRNGTDGMIFINEPKEMGFYFQKRVFEPGDALKALEDGYPVVCIQHKGYWTGSAHYLLLEELTEDGLIRVRDSNIANYGKLEGHKVDKFEWKYIPPRCDGFWVFEKKITRIPACTRCGDPEAAENLLVQGYICDKCEKALLRRNTYLTACTE